MGAKEYFRVLNIMFFMLLFGQVFFLVVVVLFVFFGIFKGAYEESNLFYFIVLLFVAGGYYGGNYFYKKMLKKIHSQTELTQKFDTMMWAILVKMLLIEGASSISSIFYLLTADNMFLIISLMIIFLFFMSRLQKEKIIADMHLSTQEHEKLKDPTAIISSALKKA